MLVSLRLGGGVGMMLQRIFDPLRQKKSDILTQFHLKGGEKISSTSTIAKFNMEPENGTLE